MILNNLEISDDVVNDAAQRVINSYIRIAGDRLLNDVISKKVFEYCDMFLASNINDIVSKYVKKYVEEHCSDVYSKIACEINLTFGDTPIGRHVYKQQAGNAIREIIYDNKEKLIEEVVSRASRHLTQKSKAEYLKQIIEGEMHD